MLLKDRRQGKIKRRQNLKGLNIGKKVRKDRRKKKKKKCVVDRIENAINRTRRETRKSGKVKIKRREKFRMVTERDRV